MVFVTARAIDGNFCATFNGDIQFTVSGDGTFEATGNGDPSSLVLPNSQKLKFFNGLVIARANEGKGGTINITAKGKGLKTKTITVKTEAQNKEIQ
ncbi:hypothetical protein MY04_4573 [Flammeovirga sp. MY04]|nr:hypothetical protein MY04_4573 [Flammeovirga sp. MY04]